MRSTLAPAAPPVLDHILNEAIRCGASDVHLEPTAADYEYRFRIDGLLGPPRKLEKAEGRAAVGRLMVLAHLLTYRLDVPQEGRLEWNDPASLRTWPMRLAVMPTTHGLRAAVRLPGQLIQPQSLEELGLGAAVLDQLRRFAAGDSGMLVVTGPAGAGKTTTIYALLRHIVQHAPEISVITLEDPVERDLPGVTQIEVKPFGELTYERCLRSILRQDPQVLVLGEIRDATTASLAVQAALSGHRLICTMHAASPAGAIQRLLEMQIEPYQITSSLFGVLAQRLLRRRSSDGGYRGRIAAAEMAPLLPELRRAILQRCDEAGLTQAIASRPDHQTLSQAAFELVQSGLTDEAETKRVFGESGGF